MILPKQVAIEDDAVSESSSEEEPDSDDDLMNEELGVSVGLSKSQSRRIDWVF